jgi:hypothetical protein
MKLGEHAGALGSWGAEKLDQLRSAIPSSPSSGTPAAPKAMPDIGDTISQVAKDSNVPLKQAVHPDVLAAMEGRPEGGIRGTVARVADETKALAGGSGGGSTPPPLNAAAAGDAAPGRPPTRMEAAAAAAKEQLGGYKASAARVGDMTAAAAKGAGSFGLSLAKKIPGAAQVYNAADAGSRVLTPGLSAEERKQEGIRGLVNSLGTTAGTVIGGVGGAALGGFALPGAGAVPGGIAGAAGGAMVGGQAADWISDKLMGPSKGKGLFDRLADAQNVPAPTKNMAADTRPDQGSMDDNIPGTWHRKGDMAERIPTEAERRAATAEVLKLETQIQANRANASPEAGGTGVSIAGLRGAPAAPANATEALSMLQGYGAASRMQKNQVEAGQRQSELGLRGEANRIAAAKAAYDMAKDQRDFDYKKSTDDRTFKTEQEEKTAKSHDTKIESFVTELTGERETGIMGVVGGEDDKAYEARRKRTGDAFRTEVNATLANRKDQRKIGELSNAEVEQLMMAKRIKNKFESGRGDAVQSLRDFFGNKRFDSRDLYSYLPAVGKDGSLQGAQIASIPGGGGYVLKSRNGNTMTATRGLGGEWNLTGPNGPVDADVAAIFAKHLDAAEKRASKGLR